MRSLENSICTWGLWAGGRVGGCARDDTTVLIHRLSGYLERYAFHISGRGNGGIELCVWSWTEIQFCILFFCSYIKKVGLWGMGTWNGNAIHLTSNWSLGTESQKYLLWRATPHLVYLNMDGPPSHTPLPALPALNTAGPAQHRAQQIPLITSSLWAIYNNG